MNRRAFATLLAGTVCSVREPPPPKPHRAPKHKKQKMRACAGAGSRMLAPPSATNRHRREKIDTRACWGQVGDASIGRFWASSR
jgi:hypothetical protein